MRTLLLGMVVLVAQACGGGSSPSPDAPVGPGVDAAGADGAAVVVPDPGSGPLPFSWPDTEPNDSASQAVPLGTSVQMGEATWFDGTMASGSLGGTDLEDWFVWKSSPMGGNFHAGPCWNGTTAPNLIDFYLYKSTGTSIVMVGSSTQTDPSCENTTGTADVMMDPNTVYLLEFRAPPGLPVTLYGA